VGSKIEANLYFSHAVTIGEGWAKCPSQFFVLDLGPNLWYSLLFTEAATRSKRLEMLLCLN